MKRCCKYKTIRTRSHKPMIIYKRTCLYQCSLSKDSSDSNDNLSYKYNKLVFYILLSKSCLLNHLPFIQIVMILSNKHKLLSTIDTLTHYSAFYICFLL
ncbi:hypothetical protein BDB01DRAFT_910147 [Pilobolus umbonatus]|nr:hypothetical protein BDB01DRAFT_910147 [Pilobolus umbonatus]